MKFLAALAFALAFLAPARAQTPPGTAAKAPAAAAKDAAKKAEPPAKIEGVAVARPKGFLGVQIVNGTFKVSFYDEKKKPAVVDVAGAVLRWDAKSKSGKERVVLSPAEDRKSLTSPRTIRPPYTFKLFITLLKDTSQTDDPVGESYVIDFSA